MTRSSHPHEPNFRAQRLFDHALRPTEKLPPAARDKFRAIRKDAADARALVKIAYEAMGEARDKATAIEARILDLTIRQNYASDHPLVTAERESLELFKKEMRDYSIDRDQRRESAAGIENLWQRIDRYVENLPPTGVAPSPETPVKLEKGETPAPALERRRARIEQLRVEIFDAENAPITSEAAKNIARRHIESMAAAGRPNVLTTLEGRRPPRLARRVDGARGAHDGEIDVEALICWLHRDALIAAIEKAIDEDADESSALSDEERATRISKAKREMLAVQREEEIFFGLCKARGLAVSRRADADPRAVLGLADAAPPPVLNS